MEIGDIRGERRVWGIEDWNETTRIERGINLNFGRVDAVIKGLYKSTKG